MTILAIQSRTHKQLDAYDRVENGKVYALDAVDAMKYCFDSHAGHVAENDLTLYLNERVLLGGTILFRWP